MFGEPESREHEAALDFLEAVSYILPVRALLSRWDERKDSLASLLLVMSALTAARHIENVVGLESSTQSVSDFDEQETFDKLYQKVNELLWQAGNSEDEAEIQIKRFLLFSTKVHQILKYKNSLGNLATAVDIERLSRARARLPAYITEIVKWAKQRV